jgi:hypothetical protein
MSETIIIWIISILQVVLAFGLINVWLLRFNKKTKYRGKGAGNMKEEFSAYGLPAWSVYVIGTAKLLVATAFIVGLWIPMLVYPAAGILVVLMLGAVSMHIKVRDPFIKMLPALLMLAMALAVVLLIHSF